MNFSGISKQKTLGKLLRFPLRLVPARAKMPIMQGAFKGKKWIAGSSDHGCWLGSYEIAKRRVFETHVTKGSIVFDVGAHVGYYTLLASVLAGAEGRIFAFEPLPQNLQFLREHVRINHLANVTVIDAAVAEKSGETRFQIGPSRSMGQLAAGGELPVRVVALDEQIAAGELPPPRLCQNRRGRCGRQSASRCAGAANNAPPHPVPRNPRGRHSSAVCPNPGRDGLQTAPGCV